MIIVFVVNQVIRYLQAVNALLYFFRILSFDSILQLIEQCERSSEFNATECLAKVSHQRIDRSNLANVLINLRYYLFIVSVLLLLCESQKISFLFCLRFKNLVVYDSLIHTDRVLPVVATLGVLRSILNTNFVAGSHLSLQHSLTSLADLDTRSVLSVHAHLNLAACKVAACASGESHNHGVIAFLQSLQ